MNVMIAKTAAEESLGVNLPSRRDEDWKWTDLRNRISKPYPRTEVTATDKDVERLLASSPVAKIASARVVFVNGKYDAAHSRLKGLQIYKNPPSHAEGLIVDLNRAVDADGRHLNFEGAADTVTEIIHVVTDAAPRVMGLHNRIFVNEGASASIVETFVGEGDYLMNSVTEIMVGRGARLDRLKLQFDSAKATHLADVKFTLLSDARLNDVSIQIGSSLTRQNGTLNFNGQNADARMSGAYLLKGKQHCDTALKINHNVPHCTSRELFKCVMDDQSRGIFQGKVYVAKDAQKTDGKQSSHALLLSETAEFDAKPELEIYADDVVCGHGTTCGDLNHDHLFYLMSRGIPKAQARAMLVQAFVAEAFETVESEAVRDALLALVEERLA